MNNESNTATMQYKYTEWWDSVSEKVFLTALRYTQVREDAEDIMQDVALAAYVNFFDFVDQEHFQRWIITRIKWRCIDYLRGRVRETSFNEDYAYSNQYTKRPPENALMAWQEISQAMENLSPRQKQVLQAYLAGKSNKEIAYELKISEPTVRSFLRFARLKLAKQLEN